MKIMVTGANGFVGKALVAELVARGDTVIAITRSEGFSEPGVTNICLNNLLDNPESILKDVEAVIHLAGRAHIGKISHTRLEDEKQRTWESNVDLTRKLADLTFRHSQARFVFLSSIGVHGRYTAQTTYINEESPYLPENMYAATKLEAEQLLKHLALAWGGNYVIVRAPLIYGPGAPANFGMLERLASAPVPLPLGGATAPRAMIGVKNLSAFLRIVAIHPLATAQTFIIADYPLLNVRQILELLRQVRNKPSQLFRPPDDALRWLLECLGRGEVYQQLFRPYLVDTTFAEKRLSWVPPYKPFENLLPLQFKPLQPSGDENSQEIENVKVLKHCLSQRQMTYLRRRQKFDQLVAGILLVAFTPILYVIALAIKLDSRGPAFFVQERAGRGHLPFKIYKFRTMRTDTPNLSTEEMQRSGLNPITRVGAILRRTSLDELPQLLNILKGEMGFVGPRPALMTQTAVLKLREQAGVDLLLPGITGYAQATGRDDLSDEEKVRRDQFYLENLGAKMDGQVLQLTVKSVLKGTGNK